jgi:hypothetical protein
MRFFLGFCIYTFCSLFNSPSLDAKSAWQGVITVNDGRGVMAAPMDVYFYRPKSFQPNGRILIALHGQSRNAEGYRDYFIEAAERHGVLVLAPEFSRQNYRGSRQFNLGNLKNRGGHFLPQSVQSFLVIDRIFEQAREQLSFNRQRYYLFGHSAGSQFVHRMMLFSPSEKIIAAVAANAGWYTEPDLEIEFPYGMANTLEGDIKFAQSFSKKLIIILGEDDDNENHRGLRTTAEAMVQGPHRLARGHNFYRRSKAVARKLGLPFKWQLKVIPDVGHSGWGMADPAADVLFGKD